MGSETVFHLAHGALIDKLDEFLEGKGVRACFKRLFKFSPEFVYNPVADTFRIGFGPDADLLARN